jgi:hypothetical protein
MVRLKVLYVHRRPHCTTRGRAQQTQAVWRPAAQASLSAWSIVPEGGPHGIARIYLHDLKQTIGPSAPPTRSVHTTILTCSSNSWCSISLCVCTYLSNDLYQMGEPTQVLLRYQQ